MLINVHSSLLSLITLLSIAIGSHWLAIGRRGSLLCLALLAVTALILSNIVDNEAVGDADDEEEPEEVETLQGAKQEQSNGERDPALVLLSFPVELIGTDGLELREQTEENAQVDVVT